MTLSVRIEQAWTGFSLDAEFTTEAHGVTALFGPSGSGKSTIINAIAGLLRPKRGQITFDGDPLFDSKTHRFVPARHRHMSVVFQDARLFPHLSVHDNLLYGWRRSDRKRRANTEDVIQLLGLTQLLERKPRTLSGGEKQRVALGRALLASPRLLLMDEPLAALGQQMKDEILPYFERLRDERRVPVIYVSHSVEEVARLADQVILLEQGRVIAQGSVFDLFSNLAPETAALSGGSVIEARVMRQLPAEHLSELSFGDVSLLVPEIKAAEGASVRVRVHARDITIALDPPGRISANNVLPVTIGGIRATSDGAAQVQLLAGDVALVALITQYSLGRLDLKTGMNVFAIIKSVTVDRSAVRSHPSRPGAS